MRKTLVMMMAATMTAAVLTAPAYAFADHPASVRPVGLTDRQIIV